MALETTTPPASEPVTLGEVKDRLRLTSTDEDGIIQQNITAAREYAEKVTRRSLAAKTYAVYFDRFPFPHEPIRLPAPPLVSVTAVKFFDNSLTLQTWDASEYFIAQHQEPALIVPKPGLIYPPTAHVPGAVEVDFIAGYGAVDGSGNPTGPICPEHLKEAIRQLAIHFYEHPEAITSDGMKELPYALSAMLNANKIYVF